MTLHLTTDFETGSGTLVRVSDTHWRLDTVGDRFGYNRYFCVRAHNQSTERQTLRLCVHPDPALPDSHFMSHFPSHLWYGVEDHSRWMPVRHTWEDAVCFHEDHLEAHLPLEPGQTLLLATNVPLPYSALMAWINSATRPGSGITQQALGRSFEDREIPVLRLGRPDRPRLLVLAGMHSSEHSGVWASQGIAEWLTCGITEGRRITDAFDIAIVPMLNPDGNVHGYSGGTAQRLPINNSLDFTDAASGAALRTHENHLLWRWLEDQFQPDYCLHFHGYMGWRRAGDHPFDGLYVLQDPQDCLSPARQRQMQAAIARLKFETPAFSAHWGITGGLGPASLEFQLARRFDTLSLLYEINVGSVGPCEQTRRGPQVLAAIARALLDDAPEPPKHA